MIIEADMFLRGGTFLTKSTMKRLSQRHLIVLVVTTKGVQDPSFQQPRCGKVLTAVTAIATVVSVLSGKTPFGSKLLTRVETTHCTVEAP